MKINWFELTKGIVKENPVFVIVLGLCPTLAVTNQAGNGFGMGVSVMFVLVFSNLLLSLLRNFIPGEARIPASILVISAFVTIVQLFLKAFAPDLDRALGIFIPLIVVNCIILGRAEAFALKNDPVHSALDGFGMGLGFTLSLTLIATIREALGSGTITFRIAGAGPVFDLHSLIKDPAAVMVLPAGGFIVIGLLLAFFNLVRIKKHRMEEKQKARSAAANGNEDKPVVQNRVGG
jgi:Na+-translocating ferredoxin:NAD+ oxidoreductase subunit E